MMIEGGRKMTFWVKKSLKFPGIFYSLTIFGKKYLYADSFN